MDRPNLEGGGKMWSPNQNGLVQGYSKNRCSRVSGSSLQIGHRGGLGNFLSEESSSSGQHIMA